MSTLEGDSCGSIRQFQGIQGWGGSERTEGVALVGRDCSTRCAASISLTYIRRIDALSCKYCDAAGWNRRRENDVSHTAALEEGRSHRAGIWLSQRIGKVERLAYAGRV